MNAHAALPPPRRGGLCGLYGHALAACLARVLRAVRPGSSPAEEHCRPYVRETRNYKVLHLSLRRIQSVMAKRDPDALVAYYTRAMMGFLLFDASPGRIAIVGLGGGSLAKFCYRHLPQSRIDVVEINPQVVALREEFHVPRDDARFQVHVDDAADYIGRASAAFDVLLIDAYSGAGVPPRLATQAFYRDCRRALRAGGILVLNLDREDVQAHTDRMAPAFDGALFTVRDRPGGNVLVLAIAGDLAQAWRVASQRGLDWLDAAPWAGLKPALVRVAAACPPG